MRTRTLAVAAATALMMTACGAGGESRLGTGDSYSVLGALAELPGPAAPGLRIQTGDLTAATEAAGLVRPESTGTDALLEWIGPLTGRVLDDSGPSPVIVPVAEVFNVGSLAEHEQFQTDLGWSLVDVDSFTEMVLPPDRFAVIAGDFGAEALTGLPEVADGVVTLGEGEDHWVDVNQRSAVRPLGVPVRLARQDGLVALSPSTPAVAEWLSGQEETLADDAALAGVASAMDEHGVLSAVLVSGGTFAGHQAISLTGAPASVQERMEEQLEALPSVTYDTVGVGWGVEDGAAVITVGYHLGTPHAAEQAVPQFESLYRDGVSMHSGAPVSEALELVSVEAVEEVVVARVLPTGAAGPYWVLDQLQGQDVLFLHR